MNGAMDAVHWRYPFQTSQCFLAFFHLAASFEDFPVLLGVLPPGAVFEERDAKYNQK